MYCISWFEPWPISVPSNEIPRSLSDICCGLDARKRVRATVGRVRLKGNMWEV